MKLSFLGILSVGLFLALNGCSDSKSKSPGVDIEGTLNQAFELVRDGKIAEGRRLMSEMVTKVEAASGNLHPDYANALFKDATFCFAIEDYDLAVEKCKTAAEIEGQDEKSKKDQLTYGMNYAEFLQIMGRDKEALEVTRQNVAERAEFYGKKHSGYSYGLAELASALIRAGKAEEALLAASECVLIDTENRNPHLAVGSGYEGIAACLSGKPGEAFSQWKNLTPELRHSIVHEFEMRIIKFAPEIMCAPLQRMATLIEEQPTASPGDLFHVLTMLSNVARQANAHEVRISALRQMVELSRGTDDKDFVLALKALAIAHSDAGDREAEINAHDEAISFCREKGLKAELAGCLREKAIAADGAKDESAGSIHEAAVAAARKSEDALTIGKTLAAHGIYMHHQGKPKQAFPLLDESLKLLPENDQYRFFVLNHIELARKGEKCRCHEQGPQTIAKMLKEAMIKEVGEGIVEDVEYSGSDPQNPYSLRVARELSAEEQQKVADAWTNVYSAVRRQLGGGDR